MRIHRHERRLQAAAPHATQAVLHGGFGRVLDLGNEGRMDLPVGRVVAAVDVPELLAQVLLRVAVPGGRHLRLWLNANPLVACGLLLGLGNLSNLAHAQEHHEAAAARRVEMRPWRVPRRPTDDSREERRFAQRQIRSGLLQELLRHRLDAVDAAAQEHAVHVELKNLFLAQEDLEHQRERRLLGLAGERPRVRQEERARELLRDRAAALRAFVFAQVVGNRARDGNWIDARVQVEPVILDRDHRVLEVRRDPIEGNVAALLVEPEPRTIGGVVENRVAHAAIEQVDSPAVAADPDDHHQHEHDGGRPRGGNDPLARLQRAQRRQTHGIDVSELRSRYIRDLRAGDTNQRSWTAVEDPESAGRPSRNRARRHRRAGTGRDRLPPAVARPRPFRPARQARNPVFRLLCVKRRIRCSRTRAT